MTVRLYGLKNCDTCRKALRELEASGIVADFTDLRTADDLPALLPHWVKTVGDRLINRSSTTWRGLSDAQKAEATGPAPEGLLASHPTLIRRPVITRGELVLAGWNEGVLRAVLEGAGS